MRSTFLKKADAFGALLLLASSLFLITALEEGGVGFAWSSGIIIAFFIISGLLWMIFLLWEWYSSRPSSTVDPMFPWKLFKNRLWMGVLMYVIQTFPFPSKIS